MQGDRDTLPGPIHFEGELRINNLQEKVPFTLTEYFKSRLPAQLCIKLTIFAAYCQDATRGKLIATDVAVEDLRVDFDLGMSHGRFCQRQTCIEKVESDVI